MRLKASAIFIVVLFATMLHFIITSIVENYIATQVGSLTGQVVAQGFTAAGEKPRSSEKDVNQIYQNMTAKSSEEFSKWKIPSFLISLPIKPILNPLKKKIRIAWIDEPVRSNKISFDQVKKRGRIIDNVDNGLNSISFGILIYLTYSLIVKFRRR